jgi:hypothetical protein
MAGKLPVAGSKTECCQVRTMFRAEIYPLSDSLVLKMAGKLIDGCAEARDNRPVK